ncbi:LOW QUALITY PROTEIN: subtilisin-like protein protease SBT1.9 [Cinnamomum micranthum f. kanehirae]|uniref:Subtilisin-like protein protease SBT1.9 n=1 Tax=Cinnamomum micranthum f. kanehirae TaxID=337451 RepID=A0A443P4X0_9MAGN|nr:LOW QUALITY PROTEIN: subtilisin-like protein protease SBT1.9 [Cinnamomum micranthum f. kanehirae]
MATSSHILLQWLLFITLLHLHIRSKVHIPCPHGPRSHAQGILQPPTMVCCYSATLNSLANANHATTPTLIYAYSHAIHGFSAILSPTELQSLKKSKGVIAIHPDMPVQIHTTHTHEFMSLNSNWGLWPVSNYGEDVIIGVVDTGIWPESASFSDKGITQVPARWKGECVESTDFNSSMCNRKLIGARYYNKGFLSHYPIHIGVNSTRDTDGHGAHTSSTAAGSFVEGASFFGYAAGTASGMAPGARVAMYKAIWDGGIGYSSDVLAAIDQAIADGVDVISVIGLWTTPFPSRSNGNCIIHGHGKEHFFCRCFSGERRTCCCDCTKFSSMDANGASAIDRKFAGTVTLGNGATLIGMSLFPANALILDVPLIYSDSIKACDSTTDLSSAKDSIVFCDYIRPPLVQMSQVCNSGAAGAIIPAPTVGAYSSRGPSLISRAILKPDLVASGSRILAAYPPNVPAARLASGVALSSEFQLITGTSMACPHVAGVAALLKGAHPGALIYDAGARDYVNFLCSLNYTNNEMMMITRGSSYNCSNPSSDLNFPSFIAVFNPNNNTSATSKVVQQFQRTVTYVAKGPSTYTAKVVLMPGLSARVVPDTLVFQGKNEKLNFTLSMEGSLEGEGMVLYGSLIWVDEDVKHRVRSPIVVTNVL